jgi:glycosyltransferase involved in cell wall biosynthesis
MDSPSLVSIVTPFYNTADYLADCIESVLCQSYPHWEYILIDNCSNDGSFEIAQSYASRFPSKIRVARTGSFLSQVANYNFALSCISPQSMYCKIVQADDWIYPECIERMVSLAERDRSIGIVSSYRFKGNHVLGEGLPCTQSVFNGREVSRLQLSSSLFVTGTPTTVLYRSEIVREMSPFYDEQTFFDDSDACYRIMRSWNFGFVHQILSFSRVDDDSIRGKVVSFGPDSLERLVQLAKFGPIYLSEAELKKALGEAKSGYYRFLVRRAVAGGGDGFWEFHKSGLTSAGLRLEWALVAKHACLELLHLVTNPGETCARIYNRMRLAPNRSTLHHWAPRAPGPRIE